VQVQILLFSQTLLTPPLNNSNLHPHMTPEETASALPDGDEAATSAPSLLAFPDWLEQNQATIKEPLQKYRGYSDYVKQETLAQGRYSDTLVQKLDAKLAGLAVEAGDYVSPTPDAEPLVSDVLARPKSDELPLDSILNYAYSSETQDDDPLRTAAANLKARRQLADEGRGTPEELAAAEADLRQLATPELLSRATRKDVKEGRSLAAIVPPEDPEGAPTVEINDALLDFVNEDGTVDEPALGKALKLHNTDPSLIPAIRAKLTRPDGYGKSAVEIERHGEAMSTLDTLARTAGSERVFDELGKIANSRERGNSYAQEYGVFNLRRAMGEQAKGKSDAELLTLADDFNNMNAMPEIDEENPSAALRTLSTGQVVAPLNLMLNDTAFEKALDAVPAAQRPHIQAQREYAVESSASDIIRTISDNPQGGDEFVAYMDSQRAAGKKDSQIVKDWIGMGKYSTTESYLSGIRSSLGEAVMPFVALATGADPDGFAIRAMQGAQIEDANRRAVADLFGKQLGVGYDLSRLVAPVAVDLGASFLTRGASMAATTAARATAGAAVKSLFRSALTTETRSLVGAWVRSSARSGIKSAGLQVTGRETVDEVVSMAGRDIVNKIATGTAYATSMATAFNRSGLSTYASLSTALANQTNPDGTAKYSPEEVKEIAMTHGLAAGTITAVVMGGFMGLGAPGMEMVLRKGLTNGQYARIAGRLKKDVSGFGAADANTMIAQFVKQGVTPLFKSPTLLGAAQEGAEEGLDTFMQYFNEAMATGDRISIADAAKQAMYAASLGGVMGGTIAGVGTAIKDRSTPSPRVEADIRRERLLEMAGKLEATAPQTAQVFRNYAFQQRSLIPQRQQLESDLKAAKTPEAKLAIQTKIDTLNDNATRSRTEELTQTPDRLGTEELAPTQENIPEADAAEGTVEAPVDAGMAPEGAPVVEGTPEADVVGDGVAEPVRGSDRVATRETVEDAMANRQPIPRATAEAAGFVFVPGYTLQGDTYQPATRETVETEFVELVEPDETGLPEMTADMRSLLTEPGGAEAYARQVGKFAGQGLSADQREAAQVEAARAELTSSPSPTDSLPEGQVVSVADTGATPEDQVELDRLDELMLKKGQKENGVKGATFTAAERKEYNALVSKHRRNLFTKVTPEEDTKVGTNAAGEPLYEQADGQRYRMRFDSPNTRPNGYPDFGGDLASVETADTLPGFTMPPRKRSLSSMRDATVDKLDAIDRRLAAESDADNMGVLEAGKQRLTALLSNIENIMLTEANAARIRSMKFTDGKQEVRPSADPEDIVTIAEAEDVPVVEVVKSDPNSDIPTDIQTRKEIATLAKKNEKRTPEDEVALAEFGKKHPNYVMGVLEATRPPVAMNRGDMGASDRVLEAAGRSDIRVVKMMRETQTPPTTPRPKLSEGATQTIIQSRNVNNFIGPRNADIRAAIMSEIEGKKVPKSKAGFNAFVDAMANHFGVTKEGKTLNAYETAIIQAVKDSAAPAPAAQAAPATKQIPLEGLSPVIPGVTVIAETQGRSKETSVTLTPQNIIEEVEKGAEAPSQFALMQWIARYDNSKSFVMEGEPPAAKFVRLFGEWQKAGSPPIDFNSGRDLPTDTTPPTISDILADVPPGYPLDRDTAKLVSAAVAMPGGLLSAMAANPVVADAVKRYAASRGVDTGNDLAGLALIMRGELEADSVLAELRGDTTRMTPDDFENSSGWVDASTMSPEAISIAEKLNQEYIVDKQETYEKRTGRKITSYRRRVGGSESASPSTDGGLPVGQVGSKPVGAAQAASGSGRGEAVDSGTALEGIAAGHGTDWVFDKNGYVAKPGFGAKWTPEETNSMREKFKAAGIFTSTMKASGKVDDRLVGRFKIYDAGRETKVKDLQNLIFQREQMGRENAKKEKAKSEQDKVAQTLGDADQAAMAWITETFGADFANAHNKAGLADYLSGKTPTFELYRVNAKWVPGLTKIGAISGSDVDMRKVKAAYEAASTPRNLPSSTPASKDALNESRAVKQYPKLETRFEKDGKEWLLKEDRSGAVIGKGKTKAEAVNMAERTLLWQQGWNEEYQSVYEMVDSFIDANKIDAEPYGIAEKYKPTRDELLALFKRRKAEKEIEIENDIKAARRVWAIPGDGVKWARQFVAELETRIAKLETDTPRNLPSSTPSSAVTAELDKFGFSEGLPTFLANVAKKGGKQYAPLAKLLLDAGAGNVDTRTVNLPNTEAAGFYVGANGVVHINTAKNGPRGAVDTVLHELVHAVTEGSLKNPTPAQQKIIARIERVRATVTKRAKANGTFDNDLQYALGDNAEFLTHFFTSQRFRDQVSAMTPKSEKNWIQVIADLIADLFTGRTQAQKMEDSLRKELTTLITAPRIGLAPSDVVMRLPAPSDNIPTEQQFNETIRQRITGRWNPGQRAEETRNFINDFFDRNDATFRGLGWRIARDARLDKPDIANAGFQDGELVISVSPANAGEQSSAIDSEFAAKKALARALEEEIIHAFHMDAVNRAGKLDRFGSNVPKSLAFAAHNATALMDVVKESDAQLETLVKAWELYTREPKSSGLIKSLIGKDMQTSNVIVGETVRMLAQLRRSGGITEDAAVAAFENPEARAWNAERIGAIRAAAQNLDLITDKARQDIRDLETLSNSSPDIRFQPTSDARNVARFHQLTESLYRGRDSVTAAEIEAWKTENPEKWGELSAMREEVLRAGGWDVKAYRGDDSGRTVLGSTVDDPNIPVVFATSSEKVAAIYGKEAKSFFVKNPNPYTNNANYKTKAETFNVEDIQYYVQKEGRSGAVITDVIDIPDGMLDDMTPAEAREYASDIHVLFDPSQIKSAEPISPGPRLTPDRWADAASPDIRFQPAARPAPDFAAAEQKFNNQVNEYVTGNWPSDTEGRYAELMSFAGQWGATYVGVPIRVEMGAETQPQLSFDGAGNPTVVFGGNTAIRIADRSELTEAEAKQLIANEVNEEVIHYAHHLVAQKRIGATSQYAVAAEMKDMVIEMLKHPNPQTRKRFARAAYEAYATYEGFEIANDTGVDHSAELLGYMTNPKYTPFHYRLGYEMVRQAVQARVFGTITEAMKVATYPRLLQWFKDRLAAIRSIASNTRVLGERFSKDIIETEAVIRSLRSPDIRFQPAARNTDASVAASLAIQNPTRSLAVDIKYLADFGEGNALVSERFDRIPMSVRRSVLGHMNSLALNNPEILQAVVRSIPVDMVDNLSSQQFPTDALLNDPAVLKDVFSSFSDNPVAIPVEASDSIRLLVVKMAELRAEIVDRSANLGRGFGTIDTAVTAPDEGSRGSRETAVFPSREVAAFTTKSPLPSVEITGRSEKVGVADFARLVGHPKSISSVEANDKAYFAAVEAGDMETAQRMVDDAARAAGYNQEVYHGTAAKEVFTIFKDYMPNFFTTSSEYASGYTSKGGGKGRVLRLFFKTTSPLDTRTPEGRKVFNEEFIPWVREKGWQKDRFGEGAELSEGELVDFTKADLVFPFLKSLLRAGDTRFDSYIVDEAFGDYPPSVVPVSPSQIKSADPVTYDDAGNVIPLSQRFQSTSPDIRFQGLTEQDFTPASLHDTATGFLPDDVTLDDLTIDFADLADITEGLDPVNAENAVHAAVNHALARRAGEAAIPAPARSEFDSDEAFDAATQEHAAEVARLTDTYELITRGRLTSEAMFRYRTNPGALQRLVDYLTAAIKAAYNRFTARYDVGTAVALNRMSRDLAKARKGFNHDIEPMAAFDPDAEPIRFQFAGESANTPQFMRDSLDTAKAMAAAGKPSEEIRAVTGWFPGKYDGKMRWEIPDARAKLTENPRVWNQNEGRANSRQGYKLSDVLDHPALFEAYPALKDVQVSVRYGRGNQREGAFLGRDARAGYGMSISANGKSKKEALSVLVHEVQHAIQKIEDFARGGNPSVGARSVAKSDPKVIAAKQAAIEAEAEYARLHEAAVKRLRDARGGNPVTLENELADLEPEVVESINKMTRAKVAASYVEPNVAAARVSEDEAFGAYRGIAGEIEARDVQARANMTPEQLAATAPYSSENIAPEDAIVLMDSSGASDIRFQPAAQPASPARQEQQLLEAEAPMQRIDLLYKRDPSVKAGADITPSENKVIRRLVEFFINPFGALSRSNTKSKQNRDAMMETMEYTVSTLSKRLDAARRKEDADPTLVQLAVGNIDPLLTPAMQEKIAEDFVNEVSDAEQEIEATYEEEAVSAPVAAAENRAVALAEAHKTAERNRQKAIWSARSAEADSRREQQLQALAQLERTAPDTYEAIIDLRGTVNRLQRLVKEANPESPEIHAIVDQSFGVYLVRSYGIHQDPKQIDLMMNSQEPLYKERREALTAFFKGKAFDEIMLELDKDPQFFKQYGQSFDYDKAIADMKRIAEAESGERAQQMFEDYMLSRQSARGTFGEGSTVTNEIQRYMAKANMPQEFLDALMVNEDPVFNIANTAMSLGRLVFNSRMLNEIYDSGIESGRLITEAEFKTGITYADGKEEMRRVFGTEGNDEVKLEVLDVLVKHLNAKAQEAYDNGRSDTPPDKDALYVQAAQAMQDFATTPNAQLSDILPQLGRRADRTATDTFISSKDLSRESKAKLQARPGRFAGWQPLVTTNVGNSAFKPLGGMYAEPEQVKAFNATFRINSNGIGHFADDFVAKAHRSVIAAAGASLLVATQGSPAYFVRNVVGNTFVGLMNGVTPFRPENIALAGRTFRNLINERGEPTAEMQELIAGRIVMDAAQIGYIKQLIEDYTGNPDATVEELVGESARADIKAGKLVKGSKKAAKAFMTKLSKLSEATEVLATVMIYADFKRILTDADFGTEIEIIQEASRLTKRVTPGRSETASGVTALTRSGFGALFAPFLRFKVDTVRIMVNSLKLAHEMSNSDNPVLKKHGRIKMASWYSTVGLLSIAMPLIFQRAFGGFGEDEDEAIRASLPDYYRNASLFYFRNSENNGITIINTTFTNPLSFVGDPISRITNAALFGDASDIPGILGRFVTEDFIGENIVASNAMDVMRNKDSNTNYPIYFEADSDVDKVTKSAIHLGKAYTPRIFIQGDRFVDSLRREGDQEFWYSPLGVSLATVAPFRPMSKTFDDMERAAFNNIRKENSELWRVTSPIFSPAPLAAGEANERYAERVAIMEKQARKALELYDGFTKIRGGDEASVKRSAVGAGMSKRRATLLFNRGLVERLVFPEDDLRRVREIDPARYDEIKAAMRERPSLSPVER
jgi:hypothetical protein